MIKPSTEIPIISKDDISNPEKLEHLLNTIKMYCEELARKSQSMQEEIRTTAPRVNEIEEGEYVRVTIGANHHIYTKKNGVIKNWLLS